MAEDGQKSPGHGQAEWKMWESECQGRRAGRKSLQQKRGGMERKEEGIVLVCQGGITYLL